MKSISIFILSISATLALQVASYFLGISELVAFVFAMGLVGWVIETYSRKPARSLINRTSPKRLPAPGKVSARERAWAQSDQRAA